MVHQAYCPLVHPVLMGHRFEPGLLTLLAVQILNDEYLQNLVHVEVEVRLIP